MSLDNYSKQLLAPTTNPSGTITLEAQHLNTKSGYSIQIIVTGSLSFTSTLWASNDPAPIEANRVYTPLQNSITIISTPGVWYDNAPSNISSVKPIFTAFSGTGTLTVNFTAKDI